MFSTIFRMKKVMRNEEWTTLFRINYSEPLIMLATLIKWFILAILTGTIAGTGTSLFLHALYFSSDKNSAYPVMASNDLASNRRNFKWVDYLLWLSAIGMHLKTKRIL